MVGERTCALMTVDFKSVVEKMPVLIDHPVMHI